MRLVAAHSELGIEQWVGLQSQVAPSASAGTYLCLCFVIVHDTFTSYGEL